MVQTNKPFDVSADVTSAVVAGVSPGAVSDVSTAAVSDVSTAAVTDVAPARKQKRIIIHNGVRNESVCILMKVGSHIKRKKNIMKTHTHNK